MAVTRTSRRGPWSDQLIHRIGSAVVMGMFAICAWPAAAQDRLPQGPAVELPLISCPTIIGLKGRLVLEQWAETASCARPARTRVTDRYLGFSCQEDIARKSACRSFLPPPDSRVFDTSQHRHCVEAAFTLSDAEIVITRIRIWGGETKQCDESPSAEALAMEVDLAGGDVCAGRFCMPADRLLPIGKTRLRQLIEKVLADLGTGSRGASSLPTQAVSENRR